MRVYLVVAAVGIILGGSLMYLLFWPSFEEVVTYRTEVEYIQKDSIIYSIKDSIIYSYIDSTIVSKEPEKYDSVRFYSGAIKLEYGELNWRAKTLGYLDSYEFSPSLKIPVTTNTITTTKYNKPKRLYGFVESDIKTPPTVGLTYINNKFLGGASYSFYNDRMNFKIGYLIFGK